MAHLSILGEGFPILPVEKNAGTDNTFTLIVYRPRVLRILKADILVFPERLRAGSLCGAPPELGTAQVVRYIQGIVKVGGVAVSRLVRVRRRKEGTTLVEGYSGPNGNFRFAWTDYSGMVDVTIYDVGETYVDHNCKIFDMIQSE